MTYRLTTSAIALSTACLAAPVLADVTAADVWENQQALYAGMGIAMNGELMDGALTAPQISIVLPQGVASMQITTDATVTFEENGDGTVTITYPSPMDVTIAGGDNEGSSFEADFTMTHDSYTILASGTAGDVSYETDAQNLVFKAGNLTIQSPDTPDDFQMDGTVSMTEWVANTQVTVGNVVTLVSESTVGETTTDFTFTADNVVSTNKQRTLPMQSSTNGTFPVGGSDVMNLSQATRDGLSFRIETTGEGSTSTSETMLDGELLNRQVTSTGSQAFDLSFDDSGVGVSGDASNFQVTINDQMVLPGDIEFGMKTVSVNYQLPLNASEEAQDFQLATSLQGLTLGDQIWNLFDPAGQLPRDPAEVTFDITGSGSLGMDLLDFVGLGEMSAPPPIEVDQITIENLRIAALGADATAQGSMTLDWSDFETIPGVPRPEGAITVNLNGANALMDTLAQMGFVAEQDLMMPRMMLGMFTTPVGDDQLETVLEVNEEGHVLANGQRLQ